MPVTGVPPTPTAQASGALDEIPERMGFGTAFLLRSLPRPLPQEDELRRALTAAAVGWLFLMLGPGYALVAWLFESLPAFYYGLAGGAFATAAVALGVLRRGHPRAAAWILLCGGTLDVLLAFLREGSRTPAASNSVIVIVMAALLVGWRGVLAVGVPFGALIVAAHAAEERGLFHPQPRFSSGWVFAIMQVASLTVMLVIVDRILLGLLRARRELEGKLRQAHRLEAVGRLAGGVAHDFNNLLTVILANTAMVEAAAVLPSVRDDARAIRAAAERAAALTKQLLAFSRQQRLLPTTFDLRGLLDEFEGMLGRVLPETIKIERETSTSTSPPPLWISADPGQISQVLMNLAVNARDAMPDGGTLTLSARYQDGDLTSLGLPAGRTVRVAVRDSGAGMDEITRERAFEPFFSTKATGTGLGLATVHGIVTQSGGAIRVSSRKGAGSEFEVFLPAAVAPRPEDAPPAVVAAARGKAAETILLVEDNAQVRAAGARMLRARGHEVIECGGVTEAHRQWQAEGHRIDLVLTDVIMPDGNGPTLIRALLKQRPVRVLFMSGYLDESLRDPLLGRAPFIPKPFMTAELAAKVDEVLRGPPLAPEAETDA